MKTEFEHKYDVGDAVFYKQGARVSAGTIDRVVCTKIQFRDAPFVTYEIMDERTGGRVCNIRESDVAFTPNELFGIATTVIVDIKTTRGV